MKPDERLEGLAKLGIYIDAIDEAEREALSLKVRNENPWFTPGSINLALEGIRRYLDPLKLKKWSSHYTITPQKIRQIAVVMAGNIPLAGFHDMLSVLVSGHALMAKAPQTPVSNEFYYIVSGKCTECSGFHEEPQCAAVCPVDCCVPDPDVVETKEELLAKKAWLHQEVEQGL